MSKHKIEILTTELEELPVVRAWTGFGQPAPRRVEILRWKQKSVIYRLAGVGSGGSDVIGKSCHQHVAALEHRIYADVLPQMGMESLGYYGFADGRSDAERDLAGAEAATPRHLSWIFLEDARGEKFEPGNPKHRELATRWLSRLHTASLGLTEELPQRGTDHYFEHLCSARQTIRQNYSNPGLSPADREVLDQILHRLDLVGSRWVEVEAICRTMPRSLVHVDFAERNVRVRGTVPISGSSFLIGRSQAGVWCRWILPTINALLVARARHLVLDGSRNPAAPDNPVQAAPRRSCGHKLDCRKPGDGACRQAYPPLDCLLRAHD